MLGLAVCLGATAILAAAVLGVGLVRRRLAVVEVAGLSMEPVLSSGDRVLVRRARLSELRPGLVAVVEMPRLDADGPELPPGWPPRHREWLIKRVAALPGDRLPAGVPSPGPDPDHRGVVPPGMFVVLGDNAMWSYDSRMIGCVPAERLLGVMIRPLNGRPVPAARLEVPAVLDDVGRHLRAIKNKSWPPAWFGAGRGSTSDVAARSEELLDERFGRPS